MMALHAWNTTNSLTFAELYRFSDFAFANARWTGLAVAIGLFLFLLSLVSYLKSPMSLGLRILALSLRSVGLGLLIVCLLEPMATLERPKPQANSFAIVVDRSKSFDLMIHKAMDHTANTLEPLFRDEASWQRKLGDDFRLRRYVFDSTLEPIDTLEGILFQGGESSLFHSLQSLEERYQGRPMAGVLLLTDGQATDRISENLKSKYPFPIYPVSLGNLSNRRDIRIASVTTSQSDFETAPVTIQARVTHRGFPGKEVKVELIDGQGKSVQSQSLSLKQDDEPVLAEFRFRPEKPGVQGYRVVVREQSEQLGSATSDGQSTTELTLGNNIRYQVIDRGRGPYRILYIAGRPNWEYKFLKRGLEEDDEIKLTTLIRIAKKELKFSFRDSKVDSSNPLFSGFEDVVPEEKEQYDEPVFARLGLANAGELKRGFPKDIDELFEYSAIILDDIEHDFFTSDQQAMLRQFVAVRGGGMLMLGGQESMRGKGFRESIFGQMLPIYGDDESALSTTANQNMIGLDDTTTVRYELTREGWLQPFLRLADGEAAEKSRIAAMPGFQVFNHVKGVKPGASILAKAVESKDNHNPLLVTQRFGKGRTASFLLGDMWRWGLHHQGKDQSPLLQSWRQMVRWLIADVPKRIEMRIDEGQSSSKMTKILINVKGLDFKSLDNATVDLSITSPSGTTTTAKAESSSRKAGQYESTLVADEEGVYSMLAEVHSPDGSMLGTSQLGWAYEPSALEFMDVGENRTVLDELAKNSGGEVISINNLDSFVNSLPSRRVPVTETKVVPLWHQGWVLIIALGCFCFEWGLRRRNGMA